jgi:hypothetical protein
MVFVAVMATSSLGANNNMDKIKEEISIIEQKAETEVNALVADAPGFIATAATPMQNVAHYISKSANTALAIEVAGVVVVAYFVYNMFFAPAEDNVVDYN